MRLRLAEFSLSLHPEKTKLIEFGRYAAERRHQRGLNKPETFTFLGLRLDLRSIKPRAFPGSPEDATRPHAGTLKRVKDELRRRMHQPIPDQGRWLRQVVTGFFAYHAAPTNARALSAFRHHVSVLWKRALSRRSQRATFTWERTLKLVEDWLPHGRIRHPWPGQRFDVKHRGGSRVPKLGLLGSERERAAMRVPTANNK